MLIISPWCKALRSSNRPHPKNYPWWPQVVRELSEYEIVQVGVKGEPILVNDFRPNLPLPVLAQLIKDCKTWISVDSFFQHYAWSLNKAGIVLWGQSDPNIFGHSMHYNLLKGQQYLALNQFALWDEQTYKEECFVQPAEVVAKVNEIISK